MKIQPRPEYIIATHLSDWKWNLHHLNKYNKPTNPTSQNPLISPHGHYHAQKHEEHNKISSYNYSHKIASDSLKLLGEKKKQKHNIKPSHYATNSFISISTTIQRLWTKYGRH